MCTREKEDACVRVHRGLHCDCVRLRAWGKGREREGGSVPTGLYVYTRRGLAVEEQEPESRNDRAGRWAPVMVRWSKEIPRAQGKEARRCTSFKWVCTRGAA